MGVYVCCMHMAAETCVDKWQRAYVWHAGWSHDNRLLFAVTGSGCDSRGADTAREHVALHACNNQRDCAVLDGLQCWSVSEGRRGSQKKRACVCVCV